jgi:hypothetical protein
MLLAAVWLCPPALAADYQDPAYQAAVADASVREQHEVCRQLFAVSPANPHLEWEGAAGASRVKVLTWTGSWISGYAGRDLTVAYSEMWVTAAPELMMWYRDRRLTATAPRVEQLLGLPPEAGKTHFAEMWVWPRHLVRPAPDPEVSDHEAELDFRDSPYLRVADEYRRWFEDRLDTVYSGDWPYPWTGLGYTYDWGGRDHVGLSEYIIPTGYSVTVAAVYTNRQYFHRVGPGKLLDAAAPAGISSEEKQ